MPVHHILAKFNNCLESGKDSVILKKLVTPSKEELIKDLREIAKEGRKRLERKGIKEEDISKMVERARKK